MLFGSTDVDVKMRDVIEVGLVLVNGKKKGTLQSDVFDGISSIANAHPANITESQPTLD